MNIYLIPSIFVPAILASSAILMTSSCQNDDSDAQYSAEESRPSPRHSMETIYSAEDKAYHPISRYARFPTNVRVLMQSVAIENDECRGGSGNLPETYRACDRRDLIVTEIKKRGWCWGSVDSMAASAEFYWLECKDIHR
jgi:hypothetical protein